MYCMSIISQEFLGLGAFSQDTLLRIIAENVAISQLVWLLATCGKQWPMMRKMGIPGSP